MPKKYAMKKFAIFLSLANPEIAFRIYLLWLLERYSLCILTMTSEICSFIIEEFNEEPTEPEVEFISEQQEAPVEEFFIVEKE